MTVFTRHIKIINNLPSKRTTTGTLTLSFLYAEVIPSATVAQLTMPPNIFTKIDFTLKEKQIPK